MILTDALEKLNPLDDSHWTSDGAPRLDVLRSFTDNKSLSKSQVQKAAPKFNRDNPIINSDNSDTAPDVPSVGGLSDEIEKAKAIYDDSIKKLKVAESNKAEAEGVLTALQNQYESLHPPKSNAEVMQDYLQAQRKKLNEKAARIREFEKNGLTPEIIKMLGK